MLSWLWCCPLNGHINDMSYTASPTSTNLLPFLYRFVNVTWKQRWQLRPARVNFGCCVKCLPWPLCSVTHQAAKSTWTTWSDGSDNTRQQRQSKLSYSSQRPVNCSTAQDNVPLHPERAHTQLYVSNPTVLMYRKGDVGMAYILVNGGEGAAHNTSFLQVLQHGCFY